MVYINGGKGVAHVDNGMALDGGAALLWEDAHETCWRDCMGERALELSEAKGKGSGAFYSSPKLVETSSKELLGSDDSASIPATREQSLHFWWC
jgi:hypothetical protein